MAFFQVLARCKVGLGFPTVKRETESESVQEWVPVCYVSKCFPTVTYGHTSILGCLGWFSL